MLIRKSDGIPPREVTDPALFRSRRKVLRAGVLGATALATGYIYRRFNPARPTPQIVGNFPQPTTRAIAAGFSTTENRTPFATITHYNNYYEFDEDKTQVAVLAQNFITSPWTVQVDGLVGRPQTFDIDSLIRAMPMARRVYRMRCVEGWSMVIPWNGFELGALLDRVQPLSAARYVAFTSVLDPRQMPGQNGGALAWPYVEGLRMDEAMHPLTILATGLYDQPLLPQDGAPIRLVVPWKYGFKGIKAIMRITLTDAQPPTSWSLAAPGIYGFYANVNPDVGSSTAAGQVDENRLGEGVRPTRLFNGYADQVAHLYSGMDLSTNI